MERNGIAIAGNIITDIVKVIDSYPERTMLSNISSVAKAVGGCVPNTAINLAKMDSTIPIWALGKVGEDENGVLVVHTMKQYGIHTEGIKTDPYLPTSFSDVMTESTGGVRTFFHHRGANAALTVEDILSQTLTCKLFHVGYLLLLDELDKEDKNYGTQMARLLAELYAKGIRTSIDVVSDQNKDLSAIITPVLPYCNYVLMNETECENASKIPARDENGELLIANIKKSMEQLMAGGIKNKLIVHAPELGICLNADGVFTIVPSLELPDGYIKGSVGAGDSYGAAVLYGIYQGWNDQKILELASCAAACNLSEVNSIDGMKTMDELLVMNQTFPRKKRKEDRSCW